MGREMRDLPTVHAEGFLGYAFELIYLTQAQRNLRKSLWFQVLGKTMVFKTDNHLSAAFGRQQPRALTLDGIFRRGPNIDDVGPAHTPCGAFEPPPAHLQESYFSDKIDQIG